MTCIVAVTDHRTLVMGADSASVGEHDVHIRATPKLFRTGPYAIGYTRSWRMGQILRHLTEFPEPPGTTDGDALDHFMVAELIPAVRRSFHDHGFAKTSRVARSADYTEEGQEVSGVFLVGLAGQVFEIREDYQVVRPATPYAAVGAGAITALGALHVLHAHTGVELRAQAEIALAAAETYTQSVRRPFHFLEV